jgi:serine/threonine protein kinase
MTTPFHSILGEKYRLIRQIDEGAMGSVWLAEHLSLHSPVAIKLIAPEVADTEDGVQRFFREARTAAALRNPHVVQILDYGVQQGIPYIVMELLEGEPLSERLRRVQRLSFAETEHVLRHVSRALSRAHDAGIVHRDLKPANVFIVSNEEEELVKLLDFGIAKAGAFVLTASMASNTRTGVFLGTPFYMSPEQVEGKKSLDCRADIWGMGVLAYECLLGELPFAGDTFGSLVLSICARPLPVPSERGPVPAGFDAWFFRACARDPAERFQSAREAAAELRRLSDGVLEMGERAPTTDRLSSAGFAGTNGGSSESTSRRRGASRSKRRALTTPLVLGTGVLFIAVLLIAVSFFVVRPSPDTPGGRLIPSLAAEPSDPNAKTGIHVVGEGGLLTLFVDDARIGLLPRLVELAPGPHTIVLTGGPRYVEHEERVFVKSGRIRQIGPIKLKVKRGLATLRAGNEAAQAAEVRVEVGGSSRIVPALPARVEVNALEPARLIATRAGYPNSEQPLSFEDGQAEKTFDILLAAPTGADDLAALTGAPRAPEDRRAEALATLNVDSSPSSRVLLDGKLLGVTPIADLAVEPGTHEVVFIHGVENQVKTITLAAGSAGNLQVDF